MVEWNDNVERVEEERRVNAWRDENMRNGWISLTLRYSRDCEREGHDVKNI